MEHNFLLALTLTLIAGVSTGVGSILAVFVRRDNTKFLAFSLGISSGVIIYVSMVEIFMKAKEYLCGALGTVKGSWIWVLSFFAGIVLIGLIDFFIPSTESDIGSTEERPRAEALKRMGLMTAAAIMIHNFPEGMATFLSGLQDPHIGIAIAVAMAIHNIPEGIATSLPIYYATGNRRQAFTVSFLSGLTEPAGALIGYFILRPFFGDVMFGVLFGIVAGIMMFIALEELLPMAHACEKNKSKVTILGVILGMAVMAVSLLLFL